MSPNVGNFVHDLVEMAKATERLPQVEAELVRLQQDNDALHAAIQSRELRIMDLKAEIDDVRTRLHQAEVSRDDAELRFLEADDKIAGFVRLAKDQAKALGLFIDASEPVRVEITEEPYTPPPANWGQSEVPPSSPAPDVLPQTSAETQFPTANVTTEAQAVAPADPTASSMAGAGLSFDTASPTPAGQQADALGQSDPDPTPSDGDHVLQPSSPREPGEGIAEDPVFPYEGRKYIDVPGYVRLEDWIAGGGTEENYYAGREDIAPSGFSQASHRS